ncbi:MAG: endonuclease domain-containing protein, partial [Actinomycetes bacterium]|nr:endonuclease domain-containing protein [Actinomycetes bacterium]
PARVEIVVPHGARGPRAPGLAVRRRERPPGTVARAGAQVLPREDAVVDAWARAPRHQRKTLLYDALWHRIVTARQVVRAASRVSRVPDRRRLDAILGDFLDGATSPTEVMAKREVFRHRRYSEFERQVPMRVAGRDRTLDMLHRRARLVVELDGDKYHGDRDAQVRDDERGVELMSEGFASVRFRYRDLRDRPDWCRTMVDRALVHRLAALP